MATDFSISTLLDLPTQASENIPEQRKGIELPISGSRCFPVLPSTSTSLLRAAATREHRETQKSSPAIDLTRFPAADFTTIVIPKKHTKPRRKRTAFSNIQLHFLEQFFQKKAYPSSQERNFIGSILNIGSGQVKTWYQNRRTKMKKNKVFDFEESTVSSSTLDVKCIDFVNSQPHTPPYLSSSHRNASSSHRNSHRMLEMNWFQPPCIGSNLLLQQQSMISGQHR